jgi:fibronectin type III domain protein
MANRANSKTSARATKAQRGISSRLWRYAPQAVLFIAVAIIGYAVTHGIHAANCTVSSNLVNSCRPWLGAAAAGNPKAGSGAIAQFDYLEQQIGHPLDIFHDYHPPGSLPLNSSEIHFAKRSDTYIYVNWKPAGNWADAGGSNATVNANIDKAAANIKSISPTKIFLTIWHEPQNDVSGGTSCTTKAGASAGTPAQYRAMWQNVESRFKKDGVTNVVWAMNYSGYSKWDCLVPSMWPGNSLVNWVTYDTYPDDKNTTWASTVGRFYNVLQADNSSADDFTSKPWGVAEFGTCSLADESNAYSYFASAKSALDAGTYSRLKMYMIYASTGNGAGPGCLTNYNIRNSFDGTKQADFNKFADDSHFAGTATSTSPPPKDSTPPSVPGNLHATDVSSNSISIAWNASTDNVGVAGYRIYCNGVMLDKQTGRSLVNGSLKPGESYTYYVRAYDKAGNFSDPAKLTLKTRPASTQPNGGGTNGSGSGTPSTGTDSTSPSQPPATGSTVTGNLSVGTPQTTVKVDGKTVSTSGKLNTGYLTNGKHTVTLTTTNPDGTTSTVTRVVDVENHLSFWQAARDTLFGSLRSHPALMNGSFWGSLTVVVLIVGFVTYRFWPREPLYKKLQHTSGR